MPQDIILLSVTRAAAIVRAFILAYINYTTRKKGRANASVVHLVQVWCNVYI